MCFKKILVSLIAIIAVVATIVTLKQEKNDLPLVAIANYGPHSSLNDAIAGFKKRMENQGFNENKNIHYEIVDVGFDPALIPQMISRLKNKNPAVMVVMTTPVAQFAKGAIKDIPLIYSVITDPQQAGLLSDPEKSENNITGSSDRQKPELILEFAKTLMPKVKTVGLLYATAESNDHALVSMMKEAAQKMNMQILAVPVDQTRDIPSAMTQFAGKADFIYVGASGPIQPALPVIAAKAKKMNIPVFNLNKEAVEEGLVLASFGVDYEKVGANTAKLTAQILHGKPINTLNPIYPSSQDHIGIISHRQAESFGITVPDNLKHISIVN